MTEKPKSTNSATQKELDKAQKQFEAFEDNVNSLTLDRMNTAPKEETEPQTKLSQKEIEKSKEIYLKPFRTISCRDEFNEKYREDWNFSNEYVRFIAENKEIIGDDIDIWTKPYAGVPAMWWKVPTNKPIWGPRYLAEQIKKACYHRLIMKQAPTTSIEGAGVGQFYGQMVADTIVQRLDALPVSSKKSIFMGAANF